MKQLRTEITIDASAEKVWDILLDFDAYPEWNPFIKEISGTAQKGEQIKVLIQPEGGKATRFKPVIQENKAQKEFRWLGKLFVKGLFDGEHYFLLEAISPSQTRLVHGENFRGLLSGFIMKKIGAQTEASFHSMNEALARRARQG